MNTEVATMSPIRSTLRLLILVPVYVFEHFMGQLMAAPKPWKYVAYTLAFVGLGLVIFMSAARYRHSSDSVVHQAVGIGFCLLLAAYIVARVANREAKSR